MAQLPQLHIKIVPWMNRSEVRRVYDELYSDDILRQKHALGRIDVWKSRSLHKLPLAMESTAALIQVKLEHQRTGLTVEDDRHLRTLYSMALLRFVNHVTEKGQGKTYAQPVHMLAERVGVPEWIVDLRHEATHGSLPSLSMLRAAANWALQWLKAEFWEVQKEGSHRQEMQYVIDTETKLDNLRDILVEFQQRRFKDVTEENSNTDITDLIRDLDTIFFDLRGEIYDYLIEDGYLVSTEEQLTSVGIKVKELLEEETIITPKQMRKFWKPVVRLLDKHDLLSGFVLNLASAIASEASLRNWQLCGWIVKLTPKDKKKGYYEDSVSLKDQTSLRHLLKKCALLDSPFSTKLVKSITDRIGSKFLSEDKKKLLQKLRQAYCSEQKGEELDTEAELKTIKDILVLKGDAEEDSVQCSSDNPWTLCTEVDDWSKYPLGILPNQKITYKSLELFASGNDIYEEDPMETESVHNDLGEAEDPSLADEELTEDIRQTSNARPSDWSEETLEYVKETIQLVGS